MIANDAIKLMTNAPVPTVWHITNPIAVEAISDPSTHKKRRIFPNPALADTSPFVKDQRYVILLVCT